MSNTENEGVDSNPSSPSSAQQHEQVEEAVDQTQWSGDPTAESQSQADRHTEEAVSATSWSDDPTAESQSQANQQTQAAVARTNWSDDPDAMSAAQVHQQVSEAVLQTQWNNAGTNRNPNPGISVFFTVSIDAVDLGSWSKISGLGMSIATVDRPDTAMSFFQHHLPGHLVYSPITLERPLTSDCATVMNWISAYHMLPIPTAGQISCVDQTGAVIMSWQMIGVSPLSWKGPSMDAITHNVATEVLMLHHQGFV
jgi:phage tail-like protein